MDPRLYEAAREGNVDVLKQYVDDRLDLQLTPNNNTVLHLAVKFHNDSTCVKEILAKQPSLLSRVNSKGEIPLHIASGEGHYTVVQALIERAKATDEELESGVRVATEMLRMTNGKGDTALHMAVRNNDLYDAKSSKIDGLRLAINRASYWTFEILETAKIPFEKTRVLHDEAAQRNKEAARRNHLEVVRLLTKEDPSEFLHVANKAEETPLYLAAERGCDDLVSEILQNCTSPAVGGPGGRSALHAAVIFNRRDITAQLLCRYPALINKKDNDGWTPLHYAARFGFDSRAKQLLELDKSVAYLTVDNDEKKTALHVAAGHGHINVIKELILHCPDCWEMVNARGQNILHIAVENEQNKVIEFILKDSQSISSLINQEDADGNTPLHLYAASACYVTNLLQHPRADKMAFNKENLTPLDVVTYTDIYTSNGRQIKRELRRVDAAPGLRNIISRDKTEMRNFKQGRAENKKRLPIDIRQRGETLMIVAALIASVTYAAGFTVPGGYNGNEGPNQGMAILARKAAFKAFVITDSIAMIFSSIAAFLCAIAAWGEDHTMVAKNYNRAFLLTLYAQEAMVIAFITGIYPVLAQSLGLAIFVCVFSCLSFYVYIFHANLFLCRKLLLSDKVNN